MSFVAAPSEAPGARLKEMVATGNCPRWLTATGVDVVSMWAKLARGMICSRVPESCATGCVVPGVDEVNDAAEVAVEVEPSVACAAPAAPTAGVPVPPLLAVVPLGEAGT